MCNPTFLETHGVVVLTSLLVKKSAIEAKYGHDVYDEIFSRASEHSDSANSLGQVELLKYSIISLVEDINRESLEGRFWVDLLTTMESLQNCASVIFDRFL